MPSRRARVLLAAACAAVLAAPPFAGNRIPGAEAFCLAPPPLPAAPLLSAAVRVRALAAAAAASGADGDDDLFDPFATSPHDFPSSAEAAAEGNAADNNMDNDDDDDDDDDWSPLRGAIQVERFDDAAPRAPKAQLTSQWAVPSAPTNSGSGGREEEECDPDAADADLFDPRLSPHVYSGGIPADCSTESEQQQQGQNQQVAKERVGVLLIDHGSRKSSSNDRLHAVAAAYEARCPDHYVVRAAHMEIAEPSILDGLRDLLEADAGESGATAGVSRIVCHPYFLSPGRHVREDIPRLVAEAIDVLGVTVPVVTTDPVGSRMDVMVDAIGALVDQSVRDMGGDDGGGPQRRQQRRPEPVAKKEYQLGGFFGEVQRMVDEQLD